MTHQISPEAAARRDAYRQQGRFGVQPADESGMVVDSSAGSPLLEQLPSRIVNGGSRDLSWEDFRVEWGLHDDPVACVDPVELVPEWPWVESRRRLLIGAVLAGVPIPPVVLNDRFPLAFNSKRWPIVSSSGEPTLGIAVLVGRERFRALCDFAGGRLAVPVSYFPSDGHVEKTEIADVDEMGHQMVRVGGLSSEGRRWVRERLRVPSVALELPDAESELAMARVLSDA